MKKKIMTLSMLFASCLFANNLLAQGIYVTINTGYGFGAAAANVPGFTNYTETTAPNSKGESITTTTNEQIKVSLGKGVNFGGAVGYMFNKNIGAELGISYLIGGKTTANNDAYTTSDNSNSTTLNTKSVDVAPISTPRYVPGVAGNSSSIASSSSSSTSSTSSSSYSSSTSKTTLSANMFRINPSFVLTAGFEKLNPYAKFGVIIGTGSIKYEYEETSTSALTGSNGTSNVTKSTMKLNGGLALGVNASVGVNYTLTDRISIFGEVAMTNLSYAPTKEEITENTYNGLDELSSLTTREKKIDYVDKISTSSSDVTSDATATQALKQKYSFGSFGLNVGVKIKL